MPCIGGGAGTRTSGSSVYPAVQNMLLAAQALGLGATLTTLYLNFEKEVDAALGLPEDVHSYALLPIGYPMSRFGPVRRVPLEEACMGTDETGVQGLIEQEIERCNFRSPAAANAAKSATTSPKPRSPSTRAIVATANE